VEERAAAGELKKHTEELGRRFVFVDNKNFAESKLYAITRAVVDVKTPYEPAGVRAHTVDAIMIFMGFGDRLEGLKAEVTLSSEVFVVDSPASIYVPAGTNHSYKILRGSGTYTKIVLAPGGDYNAVTS
jgi:2-isopropylmalate synthase